MGVSEAIMVSVINSYLLLCVSTVVLIEAQGGVVCHSRSCCWRPVLQI